VWYWCTDQFIVQRVLSARDIDNARRGTILGGFLKVLPLFIFVIPGIIAYSLAQKGLLTLDKADKALPVLIDALLPVGIKGLVLAGLLAALMSSLSAVFNSCSTLITIDIYKQLHPTAPEKRLVLVGQVATVALVILGLLWIPFMKFISGELYKYLQSVQAYISPPIAAVFLLGVFMKRLNGTGAMASLLTGFVLGMGRLIAELNKEHLSGLLYNYADINFLHFAIFLFAVCSAVLIVVSLATKPPSEEKVAGLTYSTATASESDPLWRRKDVVLSVILVIVVGLVWIYFRG
jgi:SSS family solute:Na+ symporter